MNHATLTESEQRECIRHAVLHVPASALPDLWRTLRLPEGDFLQKELGRTVRRAFADHADDAEPVAVER